IAPTGTRDAAHFSSDTSRIFAYSPVDGLVSFRWDGTDVKQHLKVVGQPAGGGYRSFDQDEAAPLPRRFTPAPKPDSLPPDGATDPHGDLEPGQPPPPAGIVLMAPKG